MLHRVGHFTGKNVPGGWGISSRENVENPCPHYSPRLGGWGLQLTAALHRNDLKAKSEKVGERRKARFPLFSVLHCVFVNHYVCNMVLQMLEHIAIYKKLPASLRNATWFPGPLHRLPARRGRS